MYSIDLEGNFIWHMVAIKISIIRFIIDDFPGFVECTFIDAWNKEHTIHDKMPVFTPANLNQHSAYPQDGVIACEVLAEWMDRDGRKILTVTTHRPWAVDSVENLVKFDLLEAQLTRLY